MTGTEFWEPEEWELIDGEARIVDQYPHSAAALSLAYSLDGTKLVLGTPDGTVQIWNLNLVRGGWRSWEGHTGGVNCVTFSPTGAKIATGSADKTARIWQEANEKLLAVLEGHSGPVLSIAFSPDGTKVVTGSADGTARVWRVLSGELLAILEGHLGAVKNVSFSPNGRTLITSDQHGRVLFWQISKVKIVNLQGLYAAAYEIVAIHWKDATNIILADNGGPRGCPHFYQLKLEGKW